MSKKEELEILSKLKNCDDIKKLELEARILAYEGYCDIIKVGGGVDGDGEWNADSLRNGHIKLLASALRLEKIRNILAKR